MEIRVKPEDEMNGLDIPEMGVLAYPDFSLANTSAMGIDTSISSKNNT